MDYTTGSVTLPLEDYDAMQFEMHNQDPMTREQRIEGTVHALVVCAGLGAIFVASSGAYYWIKDRYETRQLQRKYDGPTVVNQTNQTK